MGDEASQGSIVTNRKESDGLEGQSTHKKRRIDVTNTGVVRSLSGDKEAARSEIEEPTSTNDRNRGDSATDTPNFPSTNAIGLITDPSSVPTTLNDAVTCRVAESFEIIFKTVLDQAESQVSEAIRNLTRRAVIDNEYTKNLISAKVEPLKQQIEMLEKASASLTTQDRTLRTNLGLLTGIVEQKSDELQALTDQVSMPTKPMTFDAETMKHILNILLDEFKNNIAFKNIIESITRSENQILKSSNEILQERVKRLEQTVSEKVTQLEGTILDKIHELEKTAAKELASRESEQKVEQVNLKAENKKLLEKVSKMEDTIIKLEKKLSKRKSTINTIMNYLETLTERVDSLSNESHGPTK